MLSQNGWPANDPDYIATYTIPGTSQKVPLRRGDVATVLMYVAGRFHREVEPIHKGWCWGYAVRNVRGSSTAVSNHASGTAIDLNAPAHPLGTSPSSTYTAKQIAAIHKIVAACGGVVRWGGDYSGRKDSMHFEINAGSREVAALAAKIRKPAPKPSTTLPSWYTRVLRVGNTGRDVAHVQNVVHANADGKFGPATKSKVIAWQKSHGLVADGIVGPATARKMG